MKELIIKQPEIPVSKLQVYTDHGFCIIPLNGKIPKEANWIDTKYKDLSGVDGSTSIPHNFGWKLEKGYLVVDIDPRNYGFLPDTKLKLKDDSVRRVKEELGVDLMKCKVIVKTGSGGWHCYYKKPAHIKVVNELKDRFPGIEFKSHGRQVVAAGSYHPDTGNEYVFTKDSASLSEIEDIPEVLLNEIKRKGDDHLQKGLGYYTDSPQDIERAREMLSKVPYAVENDGGDNTTYRACCIGRDFGLSPEVFFDLLLEWNALCSPPWEEEELQVKMNNAYKYGENELGVKTPEAAFKDEVIDLSPLLLNTKEAKEQTDALVSWESQIEWKVVKSGDGGEEKLFAKNTFKNTALYLANHDWFKGKIALNEFANRTVWLQPANWHEDKASWPEDGIAFTDDDALRVKEFFNNKCQYDPALTTVHEAVRLVAIQNRFHPARRSILNCKWDGVRRIDTWLINYLGADDTAYVRAVSRKIMVGIVSRVFNPGCKFDYVPILEGKQGIGKSTALQILGGRWYTDTFIDMRSKDAPLLLQGKIIVEIAELDTFNRQESNTQKAFITRATDRIRAPYGRLAEEWPRQCVLIATTNQDRYLKDETGNRRFWPVKVKGLSDKLQDVRDQLFAEAYQQYLIGEPLYFTDEEVEKQASSEVSQRYDADGWIDDIAKWLDEGEFDKPITQCTSRDVWVNCFNKQASALSRKDQNRIAQCLKTLGWESKTYRENGIQKRGYVRNE